MKPKIAENKWDRNEQKYIKTPLKIKVFLEELQALCKDHNLSISHEDHNGTFIIDDYTEDNIQWLFCADSTVTNE
jgi:hypothetical protein